VERDLARVRQDEIAVGSRLKWAAISSSLMPGIRFGDEFLLGHLSFFLMAGVERGPEPQALQGVAVKGGVKRVLVAVPKVEDVPRASQNVWT
jgi:hypothetical protein